ncbi:hypothetical protein TH61_17575 [Rufibacter sp. DG15C]|uniref:hypothetical protein n=1 Tax=Rufibacter sp. DG15C TaxID=1379909 RepID=UPI00078EDE6F|nr:hypothetical protein [Rufibacter sp. DG15C]AMM52625.1 hypothetical protein TH61_17575 [Rufibacter sp. DG15C]
MTASINVPLRVKHFNAQIKHKEGKLRFNRALGTDKDDPRNYTSNLLEEALAHHAFLEIEEKDARLYRTIPTGEKQLLADAQSFLHLLFYLGHDHDQKILESKLAEKLRIKEEKEQAKKAKQNGAQLSLLDFSLEQEEEARNMPAPGKAVGFEMVEEDGVTKIKGTNFVISKFL